MTTTVERFKALAEAPPPPPTRAGAWGLSDPGAFAPLATGQPSIELTLRRRVDAPALAEPADDRAGALLKRARIHASCIEVGEAATLAAERLRLAKLLEAAAVKNAEIHCALASPELIASPDFSKKVSDLNAEAEIVAARQGETQAALAKCDAKIAALRSAAENALRQSVQITLRMAADDLEDRRKATVRKIAETLSPLLDELLQVQTMQRGPAQDVAGVIDVLLDEKFAAAKA